MGTRYSRASSGTAGTPGLPVSPCAPVLCRALALYLALYTGICICAPASISDAAASSPTWIREGAHLHVVQEDAHAQRLKEILAGITLPEGFRIALYAIVPGARHLAVSPDGTTVFVGTRDDQLWSIRTGDDAGSPVRVVNFAPKIDFVLPNGPCFAPDGTLYVAELNRILRFRDAARFVENPDPPAEAIVPQGRLIPPAEESGNHGARVCRIGPDGNLYVSLGQPYNVPPRSKLALYDAHGIGGIIRMASDGSGREVYSYGLRNSVGHDFHPVTGQLWFTDNQVDRMGDDIPPGEINRQTAPGQHFGFPWYGGGRVRTPQYAEDDLPSGLIDPVIETIAHAADLGMIFYTGDMFPPVYRHAIFSAQHGSWNRSTPVGARVMVTLFDAENAARIIPFAEGWIGPDGRYLGRPVDVAQLADGSLIVSDDFAGAVYRIDYTAP